VQRAAASGVAADEASNVTTTTTTTTTTTNNDVRVLANDVLFAHVVELQVGRSPERASLLIDTGSPDTMVLTGTVDVAALRLKEGAHFPPSFARLAKYADSSFDLRLSDTGQDLTCVAVAQSLRKAWCVNSQLNWTCADADPCALADMYGDGSLRVGTVVRDTVELPVPRDLFFMRALRVGSGKLSAMTDGAMGGILGLSPSDERGHLPSTLDQLKQLGAIDRRMFALCLADAPLFSDFESADAGDLVLGAPHDLTPEQLNANGNAEFTVPLFLNLTSPDDNNTFVPRYLVNVASVAVNGVKLPTTGAVALVDSGSVRSILPAPLYDAVAQQYADLCSTVLSTSTACHADNMMKLFGYSVLGRWSAYALRLTAADLNVFPPLVFDLGAGTVEIPWQRLFFPQDVDGDTWFGLGLSRSQGRMIVLGNNVLRGVRAVFDVDSSTITFATPNRCAVAKGFSISELPLWVIIVAGVTLALVVILIAVVTVRVCQRRKRGHRALSTPRVAVHTDGDGEPAERAPLAAHDVEERQHMAALADGLSDAAEAI